LRANNSKKGPSGSKGYFPLSTLVDDMIRGGADADNVREQARYLLAAGCIISEHLRRDLSDEDLIAITPAGHVHLELAHSDFHYLAACAEDCWLANLTLAETIRRRITMAPFWKALSWPVTLDSARDFIRYLHGRLNGRMVPADVFLEDGTGLPHDLDLTGLEAIVDAQIRKHQSKTRH